MSALLLTVPRDSWACSRGRSPLIGYENMPCIVGHLALKCGFEKHELQMKSNIAQVAEAFERQEFVLNHPILSHLVKPTNYGLFTSKLGQRLMDLNDLETPQNAEKYLTPLLAEIGVEVRFV